jgi:hypothetical protein
LDISRLRRACKTMALIAQRKAGMARMASAKDIIRLGSIELNSAAVNRVSDGSVPAIDLFG